MFVPPRCPNSACSAFRDPQHPSGKFYKLHGSFQPKCRSHPVPRFRCKICGISFSRQTFRQDYCDKKPSINVMLFKLLASGMGLRQSGRILNLSRRCTELKARKIARHLGWLNRNLTGQMPAGCEFTFDEMETFEGERAVLPVTVPIIVEKSSLFVVTSDVAPIKPSGKMNDGRRAAIAKAEQREGPRKDLSVRALRRCLQRLKFFCREHDPVGFITDKKTVYGPLIRQYFGDEMPHQTILSTETRDMRNPLWRINLTNAMARDLNGRLRRRSWLVSKQRKFLKLQLQVFASFRNFIRPRTNKQVVTPAMVLGFLPRAASFAELLSWKQSMRELSIHPLGDDSSTVGELKKLSSSP